MQLTQEALNEFKQIYREDLGINLTNEETLGLATSFFNLMQAVYRPLPDDESYSEDCTPDQDVVD